MLLFTFYNILRLKCYTFQMPRRPRAAGKRGLSLPVSPLWANEHGCVASGRFLALGAGIRPSEQFTYFKCELLQVVPVYACAILQRCQQKPQLPQFDGRAQKIAGKPAL